MRTRLAAIVATLIVAGALPATVTGRDLLRRDVEAARATRPVAPRVGLPAPSAPAVLTPRVAAAAPPASSSPGGGDFSLAGWGTSLHVGTPFYPAPAPSGPSAAAICTLRLWNASPADVFQSTPVLPTGEGCRFEVRVLDGNGEVARRQVVACAQAEGSLDLPIGVVLEEEFLVPLIAENAENGLFHGERLPTGAYVIEATWRASGPLRVEPPMGIFDNLLPMARITIRVGSP